MRSSSPTVAASLARTTRSGLRMAPVSILCAVEPAMSQARPTASRLSPVLRRACPRSVRTRCRSSSIRRRARSIDPFRTPMRIMMAGTTAPGMHAGFRRAYRRRPGRSCAPRTKRRPERQTEPANDRFAAFRRRSVRLTRQTTAGRRGNRRFMRPAQGGRRAGAASGSAGGREGRRAGERGPRSRVRAGPTRPSGGRPGGCPGDAGGASRKWPSSSS